ncbi:MAG: phage tail sheath family protein [Myxococcales bacterium]|nr:phage tail sheath family protein [Myxococcales bacterium]
MPDYFVPGIYVVEESTGPRPITAVGTSTAGFVGEVPMPKKGKPLARPKLITNWSEFIRTFGEDGAKSTPLSLAVHGFFANGGQRCFIAPIKGRSLVGTPQAPAGLDLLALEDEVAIVAAPGFTDTASHEALLSHCEQLGDRFAVLDGPETVEDLGSLARIAEARPRGGDDTPAGDGAALRPRMSDRGFGAFYFPWIVVDDPLAPGTLVNAPPSGHLAGVYARVDGTRGVHKAPANEAIRGALGLTRYVTREEHAGLNLEGVNVIRSFAREGIRIWGARTLADRTSNWRYINVRRLFNQIEESIAEGTRWVVFEPNNETLWKSITRDVSAFLMQFWRDGALMGATPEEAFFVLCNAETNPPDVIEQGRVVVLVGIAPVKPAEFIVFRIGQHAAGPSTQGAE